MPATLVKTILIFVATFAVSFAGSVQLGPVNLAVIQASLNRSFNVALWLALGGCLPEIAYAWIALKSVHFFEQYPDIQSIISTALIPIFVLIGIFTLQKKPSNQTIQQPKYGKRISVMKGFLLALLNPQLLPFWAVILMYFNGFSFLKISTLSHQVAFLLGTALGALGILVVFAFVAHRQKERLLQYIQPRRVNQIIGWIFIGLAIIQAIKLV